MIEENKAVGMRCSVGLVRVGGWVRKRRLERCAVCYGWVGGWVGGRRTYHTGVVAAVDVVDITAH